MHGFKGIRTLRCVGSAADDRWEGRPLSEANNELPCPRHFAGGPRFDVSSALARLPSCRAALSPVSPDDDIRGCGLTLTLREWEP